MDNDITALEKEWEDWVATCPSGEAYIIPQKFRPLVQYRHENAIPEDKWLNADGSVNLEKLRMIHYG